VYYPTLHQKKAGAASTAAAALQGYGRLEQIPLLETKRSQKKPKEIPSILGTPKELLSMFTTTFREK
jgi:hypothetical protein